MGPAEEGPKLFRLLYFVGAGFLCTAVINKWRDLERKSALRQQEQEEEQNQLSESIPSPAPAPAPAAVE